MYQQMFDSQLLRIYQPWQNALQYCAASSSAGGGPQLAQHCLKAEHQESN